MKENMFQLSTAPWHGQIMERKMSKINENFLLLWKPKVLLQHINQPNNSMTLPELAWEKLILSSTGEAVKSPRASASLIITPGHLTSIAPWEHETLILLVNLNVPNVCIHVKHASSSMGIFLKLSSRNFNFHLSPAIISLNNQFSLIYKKISTASHVLMHLFL